MILVDHTGRIRRVWGGYSPKLFDGHFLEVERDWLEDNLVGATVMADNHFEWGKKNLKQVTFHTKILAPPKKTKNNKDIGKLSKREQKYNQEVGRLRAPVEEIFGIMKAKCVALTKPWAESEEQLDALVWMMIGVINTSL